jgi:hypothetical protein
MTAWLRLALKVDCSALGQDREPATGRVGGEVTSKFVGGRCDQGRLLDVGRFGEESSSCCGD